MTLTNAVLDAVAGATQDQIDADFTHGAVGTGSSSEDATDSSLDTEVFRDARQNITDSAISNGSTSTTVSFFVSSVEANGNTITEFGFFDSNSGGEMQSRDTFSGVDKTNSIELFFDLDLQIEVAQNG